MLELFKQYQEYFIYAGAGLLIVGTYFLLSRTVKRSRMSNDSKRRTLYNLRTSFFFVGMLTFLIFYADELYQIILSLAALAAAMAIALKEFFLCFGGSFYRTFARPFSVGDRIQIGDIRGDVVDIGLMGTQLLEVGPHDYTHQYTGRMVAIPNSLFLTAQILNETDHILHESENFALHTFKVPINNDKGWERHRDDLLSCAKETCDKYIPDANHYFTKVARKRQVDIPWIEPRINIKFQSNTNIDLIVRVTIPVSTKGTVEQEIIRNYLNKTHAYEN